jgi:hypothetical protein
VNERLIVVQFENNDTKSLGRVFTSYGKAHKYIEEQTDILKEQGLVDSKVLILFSRRALVSEEGPSEKTPFFQVDSDIVVNEDYPMYQQYLDLHFGVISHVYIEDYRDFRIL